MSVSITGCCPISQVRSITCWTLSRYAHWVVANGQDPHSLGQLQFDLVIEVNGIRY